MSDSNDRMRARKATGPERPRYFDTDDVDRVMAILLALVSEVAAIRERLDTHERLADAGKMARGREVEQYRATTAAEGDREAWRDAYIKRLFRVIAEDLESISGKSATAVDDPD